MSLSAQSDSDPRGFTPGAVFGGVVRPPGSKSLAQRAILAAALSEGRVALRGMGAGSELGADVRAAMDLARALGAQVEQEAQSDVTWIRSTGPRGLRAEGPLALGESATLARLATAICGLSLPPGAQTELEPRGSLRKRRSDPLFQALRQAGAGIHASDPSAPGAWPVTVRSGRQTSTSETPRHWELAQPISSQEVSALWLAAAALPGETVVCVQGEIPSRPYLGLTRCVLSQFGARFEVLDSSPDRMRTRIGGPLVAPAEFWVEPDASSAAVALVAGCLSGGEIAVEGIERDSPQGDCAIVEYLERFGCRAERDATRLVASGGPTRGCTLDLHGEPDLAPLLAVVAAAAASRLGESSRLTGLGVLARKESDRLVGLSEGLSAAGWSAEIDGASLRIGPAEARTAGELVLDPRGDHRMAFAFALLGLLRSGIRVRGPGCVAKSWPRFWEDLDALRA